MLRRVVLAVLFVWSGSLAANASEINGSYLEARTCQIYTGPCFANAESALTGKDAIMAWNVDKGTHNGVDVSGLSVVLVVHASDTLGNGGIDDAKQVKSMIVVDERATEAQRKALVDFAKVRSGRAGDAVARVENAPIEMSLDLATLTGGLAAGKSVKLSTRKANPGDCICTNEVAYYPPLTKLENFVPAVSIDAEFKGRGLGTQWSMPNSRTSYMGLFAF